MTKINFKEDEIEGVINNFNSSIDDLIDVNNIFYNMNIPKDLKIKNELDNMKNEIKKCKENIIEYKLNFNKYISELNKKELELLSIVSKFEDINIDNFEL